jgi:hypothetical protein
VNKRSEGLKRLRHSAGLDGYPLEPIHERQKPAQAVVITCAESPLLTAFVASLDPLCVLQNLGGTLSLPISVREKKGDDLGWSTIEYALNVLALRHIVFLGHSSCCVPPMWRRGEWSPPFMERTRDQVSSRLREVAPLIACDNLSQAWLLEQMVRLCDWLVGTPNKTDIAMHALWFAEDQGDLFAYSRDERRFVLMSDIDTDRLFSFLEGHSDDA